ncbi:IS66 family transposase [Massilia sp. TWP1-3-3]|uniref:IS66 family transposase n=1 Tax=Massilia sp. TWP1-3-3 TaxID=2804573 RepID=UPI003CE7A356
MQPLIKRKDTQALSCPPAPVGVIDGSRADVSFVVGMVMDKFDYHLPLYRQHRRLDDAGIRVSRPWLTQLMQSTVALLEPIYDAQLESIRASRVKAMDEVPIKAGRASPGKMKQTYFWPIYGERDEICFTHSPGRSGQHVSDMPGLSPPDDGVLLSDGYAAYSSYAKQVGLTHAQFWAHARREVFEAKDIEPAHAEKALEHIAALYAAEEHIRNNDLKGAAKHAWRLAHAKPVAERFFMKIYMVGRPRHCHSSLFCPSIHVPTLAWSFSVRHTSRVFRGSQPVRSLERCQGLAACPAPRVPSAIGRAFSI